MVYVLVDISKKQEFIFKSNKLKENIYNSYVIRILTEYRDGLYENEEVSLVKYAKKYKGEKYFCGGGNSIIKFEEERNADDFMRNYSKIVLEKYQDLELYISKIKTDGKTSVAIKEELEIQCNKLKEKRKSKFKKISFGIEKLNSETGYPLIKSKILSQDDLEKPRKELERILYGETHSKDESNVKLTYELQNYKKNNSSYIGIICLDGNRMGELVRKIEDENKIDKLGEIIERIYTGAIQKYVEDMDRILQKNDKESMYITPIIMAGDDVCLVTEAGKAINAAKEIIKNIEMKSKEVYELKKLYKEEIILKACAGIVIVKAGYPFFDAYKKAENVCEQAKEASKQFKEDISLINWEIVEGANIIQNSLEDTIKKDEKYHIKPLAITENDYKLTDTQQHYVMSFDKFQELIFKVKRSKNISSSLLKEIQSFIYTGYENYKRELKNTSKIKDELFELIKDEEISNDAKIENGVLCSNGEKIYLLNDIIDSLKYFEECKK